MSSTIVIDGIFFQIGRSGIARVWLKLLQHWINQGFADQIAVVDREHTCPRIEGIRYLDAPAFRYGNEVADQRILQTICDQESAELFISTYYTLPEYTPSALLIYDMIPEIMGHDVNQPMWRQKHRAIDTAHFFAAISESTANDLRIYLGRPDLPVQVAYPGTDFQPLPPTTVDDFRQRYRLFEKPYFLISGSRAGYKDVALVFDALEDMPEIRATYTIVCTGGGVLEPELCAKANGLDVRILLLQDHDLQCAYTGATALLYPSLYEGFGLPVLEAMACGCPVICTRRSSIPEVGGDAVFYIEAEGNRVEQMRKQLHAVTTMAARSAIVDKGRRRAAEFSWSEMAQTVSVFLIECLTQVREFSTCRLCGHFTRPLFRKIVLRQHNVEYQRCHNCDATQTELPYWLAQAYDPAHEQFDTGQVTRSLINAGVVNALMRTAGLGKDSRVVDFGCGSGLLVRTLRDIGVNAWGHDRYCSPRLALGFQTGTLAEAKVINLCEVVEHFDQPRKTLDEIFAANPSMVIIQTAVRTDITKDWDYLMPEHGQHIFFLSPRTLNWLCQTYRRKLLVVSGFIVFLVDELAQRLLEPSTGTLRAEHQAVMGNILSQLWIDLFATPYMHAGLDQQLLKQRHVHT